MSWGPFDLSGRGVVITGGGGHLGRAMAHLAADAGATVLIVGRDRPRLDDVASAYVGGAGRIICEAVDVSQEDDISRALDCVISEAGAVDAWVNNAYAGTAGSLLDCTRDEVASTVGSLTDTIIVTQVVARRMIAQNRSGSIINIASMYGLVSPQPDVYSDGYEQWRNPPAYGAMKAGLIQFTRYAGAHLAADGIRVNCISPGPFPSDSVQSETAFIERLRSRVPLGRIGSSSEVAGAMVYLASDASSFTTGANLVVDGGWTAW